MLTKKTHNLSFGFIAFVLFTVFALMRAGQGFAADTDVYWQAESNCQTLFDEPLPRLPGGSYLTNMIETDVLQAHYALSSGSKLRLSFRETEKVPVYGGSFFQARSDLYERKPLQTRFERAFDGMVVLADVNMSIGYGSSSMKDRDTGMYKIRPSSLNLSVRAKVRVADWAGYEMASSEDQHLWDGRLCESYHHEFGHVLVTLQILEESQDEWLSLRGESKDELGQKSDELFQTLRERMTARQDLYHDEIEAMGREVSGSRPYLELPFSWLPAK